MAVLITEPGVRQLFFQDLPLQDVIEIPMCRGSGSREFALGAEFAPLKGTDLFISLVPWISRSLISLLEMIRPSASIGFFSAYQHTLELDYSVHSAALYFRCAQWLNPALEIQHYCQPPVFRPSVETRARTIRNLVPKGFRILGVHNETIQEKEWSSPRLANVLVQFLDLNSDYVVFNFSTKPQPRISAVSDRVVPIEGLSRQIAVCLMSKSDLFLGVDSCMLHVADFFRVPGVGLFGSTNPSEFGFLMDHPHDYVTRPSMQAIQVEPVLEALLRLAPLTRS